MDIFASVRGLFTPRGTKSAAGEYPGTWVPMGGGSAGITPANLLEANREWVYIAVDKNARSVASIRFKVMRFAARGDDEEVFEGPLVEFLENPGDGFTGKDFIYLTTVYKELTGNAFWELTGRKVVPLVPTRVSPVLVKEELAGFKYTEAGQQRVLKLKDVLHDRYIDPARPWWGVGKLQKIARWADTGSFVTEFLSRFFVNGATFGGFIETDEESQERIKLIKLGLANDHVGVANAHKIGVLPKGSKYAKSTASMAEMEMGSTDDRYRDKILAGFGVPKTLVGLTTEVNRSSAEASEYIYARWTLKPIVDDFIEFMNTNVAAALDPSGRYYFAYDEFVPINMELAIKERESASGKQPYMTINEIRAGKGLPPVEGGDVVYGNPTLVPLGTPAPAAAPVSDPADEPEDEEEEESPVPKKAMPRRARAAISHERAINNIVGKAVEILAAHQDADEGSHKAFVGRVEDHEKLIADKVRDFNNRQERDVTQKLNRITKAVKKGDLFDQSHEVGVLVDFVGPLLRGLMIEQAVAEYIDQDYPGSLDQAAPSISRIVGLAAQRFAKSYNRTTADLLEKTLNEGIEGGEDITQLTARVKAIYEFSDQVRALTVARTEAFYIANEGSREAFRQSGVVKTMRWYTAAGDACQYCAPQDGKVIGVNETFFPKGYELVGSEGGKMVLDYRAIDVPPLHPNCRCFIRPEKIDIS